MKWKYRIRMANNMLSYSRVEYAISIIICASTLMFSCLLFILTGLNGGLRKNLQRTMNAPLSRMGYVFLTDDNNIEEVEKKFLELPYIESAGAWGEYRNELLLELEEIQGKYVYDRGNVDSGTVETFIFLDDSFDLVNIKLSSGNPPSQLLNEEENILLYLGDAYKKEYEIGEVIDRGRTRYVVAGFIDKRTKIPTDTINLINRFTLSSSYPSEHVIVEVIPKLCPTQPIYFSFPEGENYDDVIYKLMMWGKEEGLEIEAASVDALIENAEKSLKPVRKYLYQMILLIGFATCILFTCIQMTQIISRKSEYGILYANGVSLKDILAILVLENSLKVGISFVIIIPLIIMLSLGLFVFDYGDRYHVMEILMKTLIFKESIIAVAIVALSSILPIGIMKRMSPVELIGGNES